MRFKRLLITACALLAAVLAAIAIAAALLVPRWLAPKIAQIVKAETGRELSIGEVELTLAPWPALALSQLRLANAPWGSQPWLAQIGRASAELDLWALLSGQLRFRQIVLSDATLLLETDSSGSGNWVMGSSSGAAKPTSPPTAFWIERLTLQSISLTYRDGKTGKATTVQLDSAALAAASAADPIELATRVTIDGKGVQVAGTIGPVAALIANTPYAVDLEGKFGTTGVGVHGHIGKPHVLGGFDLALQAKATELADTVAWFGATVPPAGPLRGAARLGGSVAAPAFSGIDLAAGTPGQLALTARGEVTGNYAAGAGYAWQSGGLELAVEGAQFDALAPWLGTPLPALGAYRIAARVSGTPAAPALPAIDVTVGGGARPRITLRGSVADLRAASGIDVKVTAMASEWWQLGRAVGDRRMPPFRASAHVRGTRQTVRVDDLELKVAESNVSASLQLVRGGPRLRVSGQLTSPLIDLSRRPPTRGAATAPVATPASPQRTDLWRFADVDVDVQIARLVFPSGRELRSGRARLALANGLLTANALTATLGGADVKLDGSVADPANMAGIDVNVALHGGELANLFAFFSRPIPAVGPYQGHARLQGSLDILRLSAIDAAAGRPGQRLRASGQIDDVLHWQGIALAVTAEVNDSASAGRLFGAELPRLPALRATANVTGPQGGYALDDLRLSLGRTSAQGRVVFAPGEPRPRMTVKLSGPVADLSELPAAQAKAAASTPAAPSPALALDVDADVRIDRLVLPDRRSLGPVSGVVQLSAGALLIKQFSVALGGAKMTVGGTVGQPSKMAALDLQVNVEATRGAGLAAFTGLTLRELPAFTASARLTDVANGYALSALSLTGPAMTVAGDAALTRGPKRLKFSATLHSALLDASSLAQPAVASTEKGAAASGARMISDMALPVDALRAIDAEVELRIDRVKFTDAAPLGPVLVRALVDGGRLQADPIQLTGDAGQLLSASAVIDADLATWDMRLEGKGLDLGAMATRFGYPGLVTGGHSDVLLRFRGRGKTLHAVLGSLDGNARMQIGALRLRNAAVSPDRGIVQRTIGLVNPFQDSDPHTEVKCFAANVPIRNGILISDQGIAAETARYNVVLSGSLNLRTEVIDIAVTPIVTGALGVGSASIASIVRVGGTLAAPALGVDAVGAAKSAVSAGVAVMATPWWLADAFLKKARSDAHPCTTALGK